MTYIRRALALARESSLSKLTNLKTGNILDYMAGKYTKSKIHGLVLPKRG